MSLCSADGFPQPSLKFPHRDEAGCSAAAVQNTPGLPAGEASTFRIYETLPEIYSQRQKSPGWSEAEEQRWADMMQSHEPVMLFADNTPVGEVWNGYEAEGLWRDAVYTLKHNSHERGRQLFFHVCLSPSITPSSQRHSDRV